MLKVKLGSPEGFEADQAMFAAAQESAQAAGFRPSWRVDVDGGWHALVAQEMIAWLADRGVSSVEQPLAEGDEDALLGLYRNSELPIFADESIHNAADVAHHWHGFCRRDSSQGPGGSSADRSAGA